MLGPYFTYVFVDTIKEKIIHEYSFGFTEFTVCVSPIQAHLELVKAIESCLQSYEVNNRFIPYILYSQKVEGLEVPYLDGNDKVVFNALFDQFFTGVKIYGDEYYGIENWKI